MKPIAEGQRLRLGTEGQSVQLRCVHVTQRNWSRVAISEEISAQPVTWFLKQSVDRDLRAQAELWGFEREGVQVGESVLGHVVKVPRIGFSDSEQLVHAFEYIPCVPPDTLVRTAPEQFADRSQDLIESCTRILDSLQAAHQTTPDLEVRDRDYGQGQRAICFKGLDVRNLAWVCDANGSLECPSDFVMFDFGRPYVTALEESGAKLLVSFALLNWGRPLRRFSSGPDLDLLDRVADAFGDRVCVQAVRAEIDLQERGRFGDPKAGNIATRLFKRVGLAGIGARYLASLRTWCDRRW